MLATTTCSRVSVRMGARGYALHRRYINTKQIAHICHGVLDWVIQAAIVDRSHELTAIVRNRVQNVDPFRLFGVNRSSGH